MLHLHLDPMYCQINSEVVPSALSFWCGPTALTDGIAVREVHTSKQEIWVRQYSAQGEPIDEAFKINEEVDPQAGQRKLFDKSAVIFFLNLSYQQSICY